MDAARYSVEVNRVSVEIESLRVSGAGLTVNLEVPEGTLHAGDAIVVKYRLLDSSGHLIQGRDTLTAR
jgi:translation initiation factor IF-2